MARKTFFGDEHREPVSRLLNKGLSYRRIAIEYGCNKDTVAQFVKRELPDLHERHIFVPDQRLLVIDIETMANLCWSWGVWQQNIYPAQIVKPKRTISFAAKWVGESKVHFLSEYHHGYDVMVQAAWDLLDEADAVIGYNSKRFDVKHLNTEFKLAGLSPPSAYQQIDLLQVTRREFAFGSNKLEEVAKRLGHGQKREHEGFALWVKCEAGDKAAWKRMKEYNINDVKLTERLFDDYRVWIPLRGRQSQKRLRELLEAA